MTALTFKQRAQGIARRWLGIQSSVSYGGVSWDDWITGAAGSGPAVNELTARSVSAVIACVNLIGGSIAAMPLHLYRRKEGGEREAYKDPLWWLLNERPSDGWSAAAMWEYLAASRLFHGDAYARILRSGPTQAAVAGFVPLHPRRITATWIGEARAYRIEPELDGPQTRRVTLYADDMLHVTGPGFDGTKSLSQLQYGLRSAAGIAISANDQASTFMADGVRPDFAIEIPGKVTGTQLDDMRRTFKERHSGMDSSRLPVVMSGGAKLHQLTMTSEDAQLLQTRAFQIEEISRIFGVPPHMIGHTDKTTSWGSGVEQMGLGFVKYTLSRHLVAFEQELNFKLFKTSRNFAEFTTAGLERGDLKGRFSAYRIALGRAGEPAWMRPSEVRRLENMPADADLDKPPPAAPAAPAPAEREETDEP